MELRAVVCLAIFFSFPIENSSSETSGSATFGSGCIGTDCTELPTSNYCRDLRGRGTTYFNSQLIQFPTSVGENSVEKGILVTEILRSQGSNIPQACVEMFQYINCLVVFPPCDMSTSLPMLLCEETCLAFDKLISNRVCDELVRGVNETVQQNQERNPEFGVVWNLFNNFNCSNPATYGHNVTTLADCSPTSCTNIFSPDIQEEVLDQTTFLECTEASSTACQTIYPVDYDITVPGRVDNDVFGIVTDISSSLDAFCTDMLEVMACSFLHPPCTSKGMQRVICDDQCPTIMEMGRRCDFSSKVSNSTSSDPFIEYLQTFNCSDPTTYLIKGLPINSTECIPLADYIGIADNQEQSASGYNVLPITLGVVLSFVGVLLLSVAIVIICGVYNLYKTKHSWKYPSSLKRRRVNATDADLATSFRLVDSPDGYILTGPASRSQTAISEEPDTPAIIILSPAEKQRYEQLFKELVVHYSNLTITEVIGQGAFGKVYSGYMINDDTARISTKVAIKAMKDVYSEEQLKEFLAESLIMKDFHHPHIVGLLGVCFDTPHGSPYIVLPFMANGSLRKYLMENRVNPASIHIYPQGLKLSTLTKMCLDIAKGMEYLADHKFVHRDLAARNCMLNEEHCVLVGDFGLARDIYSANYYRFSGNRKLPVKWAPPETINDGISNEKTDVWSYGVTCWEVFSLGRTPYPGIENHEILEHITSGKRLRKPPLCPEKLYDLVCQCWQYMPEKRPSFKEILSSLKEYWDEEHLYEVQSYGTR